MQLLCPERLPFSMYAILLSSSGSWIHSHFLIGPAKNFAFLISHFLESGVVPFIAFISLGPFIFSFYFS